jgi:hypothetical protein
MEPPTFTRSRRDREISFDYTGWLVGVGRDFPLGF